MRLPGGRGSWLRKDKVMRRLQVRQIKASEDKLWREEASDCCNGPCGCCIFVAQVTGEEID